MHMNKYGWCFRVFAILLLTAVLARSASAQDTVILYMPVIIQTQPFTPFEQEPNNSRAEANGPLQSGVTMYGIHGAADDAYDIFYFDATRTGPIRITLNNHPVSDIQLQLHTISTSEPLRYDFTAPYQIDYTITEARRYFIAIYATNSPASGQVYELTVTFPQ